MDEGVRILPIQYLKYFKGSLICGKNDMGPLALLLIPHAKEGLLRIFISLKNPKPQPGLNPQPLSPVASTLTTTPPRQLKKGKVIPVTY
jgi:hypothetical protein